MIKIGPRILSILEEKRIKLSDVAAELEVTPQAVHGQLKKANVGTSYLQRIMAATGIKSWEIFDDAEPVPDWQATDPGVGYKLRPQEAPGHLLHTLTEQDAQLALQASLELLRDLEGSPIRDTSDASKLIVLRDYPSLFGSMLQSITHHRHRIMQSTPEHSVRPPRDIPPRD